MALQTGVIKFTGRLDRLIGYRRNGKYFLRSMPDKVRQTVPTRRAARRFGMASRKGKLVRTALHPFLGMRCDGTLINRLNKLFIKAGRDQLPNLRGFHFNRHTGIEKLFSAEPVFTVNGALHIPAQELLPQGNNTHLELRLIAARISFAQNRVISTDVSSAVISLKEDVPFNGLALNVRVEGEGSLIVILQYRACKLCEGDLQPSGDRRYMAADVIHFAVPAADELIITALPGKTSHKRLVFRSAAFGRTGQFNGASSFQGASSYPLPTATNAAASPRGLNKSSLSVAASASPPPS